MNNYEELSALAEAYASALDEHRKNPRDHTLVKAWDDATSALSQAISGKEEDIIAELLTERSAQPQKPAEASEPVGYLFTSSEGNVVYSPCPWAVEGLTLQGPVYAAAPPAVLPHKLSMDIDPELQGEFRVHEAIRRKGFNQALDAALELGAQPQKVVELPAPEKDGGTDWQGDITAGCVNRMRDKCIAALDAANVKWEVKK